jgi:hypothetical protein
MKQAAIPHGLHTLDLAQFALPTACAERGTAQAPRDASRAIYQELYQASERAVVITQLSSLMRASAYEAKDFEPLRRIGWLRTLIGGRMLQQLAESLEIGL